MTYIVRLTGGLHCKDWMLVEAQRCVYSVLTTVLRTCGVGRNLDYDDI
jgi:hypothetical protein